MTTYTGNARDNKYTGTKGSDTFFAKGGNDTLDGKGGVDTAIFRGSFEQYQIKDGQGSLKVGVKGPDGNDQLTNIELLKFDDEPGKFTASWRAWHKPLNVLALA